MSVRHAALAACLTLAAAAPVKADIKINYRADSLGFSDLTPAKPVGGNPGSTLGEQRRLAFRHALSLWEARLDGPVPIELDVSFEALGCENGRVVLGHAQNMSWISGLQAPGANPEWMYPISLANQLAGEDLSPDRPDIQMGLNLSVDDAECRLEGFYYGFDSKAGEQTDFINVVLHELGHGFGISSLLDPQTGAPYLEGAMGVDAYSAHLRDLDLDRLWGELSNSERRTSMQNVRRVAWDGPRTSERVTTELGRGAPALTLEPKPAGFSGIISDSNVGVLPLDVPASGQVFALRGCNMPVQVDPGLVLLFPGRCRIDMEGLASVVRDTRAAGALLTDIIVEDSPPYPVDGMMQQPAASVPVYVLSQPDANAVLASLERGPVDARLSADKDRSTGADEKGRPYVYISRPNAPGSSVSHLDPLLRPDQLMEPSTGLFPTHNLALTIAMLADMGWSASCGDGTLSDGELCDDGARNSDHVADACRSDCTRASCGDAVRDKGEDCDDGFANDNKTPNSCRSDCRAAHCGDGVLDKGETCDEGSKNSDSEAGACRTNCMPARCGDGAVDSGEQCDEGSKNSDSRGGACRTSCVLARCGDGVKDPDEDCDDGPRNDASKPGACRPDCHAARCGDGVLDEGEACDDGADNSDSRAGACRARCELAHCGDGVVDAAEACDGSPGCDAACNKEKGSRSDNVTADGGAAPEEAPAGADAGGCGCRVAEGAHSGAGFLHAFALVLGGVFVRARRTRRKHTNARRSSDARSGSAVTQDQ